VPEVANALPSTSLIIPCFNEAGNAEQLVGRAKLAIEAAPNLDVVFVDNGSSDGTYELIKKLTENIDRLSLHSVERNIGYGNGIKHGLSFAKGEVVGWTHADLQTDPFDAVRAMESFPKDQRLFLIKGARSGRPLSDKFFTFGMSLFETVLFRQKLWDINAQPTMFSRRILPIILEGPDDFSLDLFALIAAKKNGFLELRFPVHFGPRFSGESKWNTSQSARMRFIRRTIEFSLNLAKRRWPNADSSTQGK
jgi:polyisoprenyl-phosphate glycosyltransferase